MWYDSSMSDYQNRQRPPAHFSVSSSPSMTYGHTNGIAGGTYQAIPFRGVTDPQSNSYLLNRTSTNANPSDLGKYAQYSHTRSTDTFAPQFPSPNHTYRLPHAMSLEPLARPSHARQDSPPFEDTNVTRTLQTRDGRPIVPEVSASIPKGFFQVDGKWTCYRRNYFPVSCAFSLKPDMPIDRYLYLRDGQQIQAFAVSISAKTAVMNNQESQTRGLVQHTPKRDKATESTPGKVLIQAASPLATSALAPSLHPYGATQHISPMNMTLNYEPFGGGQPQNPPTQYTFERIQFQKATANNGKRRAQQQYFHVVVELWVDVGRGGKSDWVEIATKQSHPMVVRGRSPGHYKDNGRRDSSTSMDPDRDAGGGGDGGGGLRVMPSVLSGHSHASGMNWTSAAPRGNHSYPGASYRPTANLHTSESASSSATLAGSPVELHDEPKIESPASLPSDKCPAADNWPTCDVKIVHDGEAIVDAISKKRPYMEDCSFTPETRALSRHYHAGYSLASHVDYAMAPYSHALMT